MRVSSGVMAGRLIHREMPQYPAVKNGDKVAGAQVMHAVISPEGKVERLEWVSGPQIFREPVMDAVRRWTYKPYLLDGRAVWVETTITMNVDFGGM
ncbi:energy transducer TonB [Edaphobacter flagellatus]|uniref:energy transducer TonB n=1 Tax=Edaphobacter flagellatus TaxID=1933044 RepID=UPI0021B4883C|nr:energy transducer TonB [Edaphobacter flagellatus]